MIYINGTSCISPQKTFLTDGLLPELADYTALSLSCIEPVYKEHINPTLARRLSRYIKMGVTTALTCLKDAGIEMPGAIITGTGLGSTEDNEKILLAMYENQERMINPTHFIQSTHNTISSQIAIMLKCHNYNNTYVHRGFSFETALFDGMLLMQEGRAETALIGGVDALTEGHYVNYNRINHWRQNKLGSLHMLKDKGRGVIPGEGSVHVLLSDKKTEGSYAVLKGLEMIYKPADPIKVIEKCQLFLENQGIQANDIQLLVRGDNGDTRTDHYYDSLASSMFADTTQMSYKQLCGEYDTAGAFSLWLASNILKTNSLPSSLFVSGTIEPSTISNILIYTHHRGDQHVLYLLSRV